MKFTIFLIFILINCGSEEGRVTGESEEKVQPSPITTQNNRAYPEESNLDCQSGTNLSYENFGEAFMLEYCTSCHSLDTIEADRFGAPLTINLDRPEDVLKWRVKIIQNSANTTITNAMPPFEAHISKVERENLREWLKCGAPMGRDKID